MSCAAQHETAEGGGAGEHWEPTAEVVLLQSLLAAGYMSHRDLVAQLAAVNARRPAARPRTLADVQSEANLVLGAVGMDLVQLRDDFDAGSVYFAVVAREALPKFLNKLVMVPAHALQLKDMLDRMLANARCAGVAPDSLPLSSFPARDAIIAQMVAERRFVPVAEGSERLFVGARLLYEIEDYLAARYGGRTLFRCLGCDKWLLKGRLCSNEQCGARLHERCYAAFFDSRGLPAGACPECSASL